VSLLKTIINKVVNFFHLKNERKALTYEKALPLPQVKYSEQQKNKPLVIRQDEDHPSQAYVELKNIFRDIGRLSAIAETMGRDFLTAMPEGAWKTRLGQISYLHCRVHNDLVNKNVEHLLDKAKSHKENHSYDWDEWDSANLREMETLFNSHKAISEELVAKKARLSYEGRRRHREALKNGDWPLARGFLNDIVDLHRQIAESKCKVSGQNSLYQALMEEHLPGIKVSDVEDWFQVIQKKVNKILPETIELQKERPVIQDITDFYPAKAQMWLNRAMLEAIGFDFLRGGLYETGHNPVEGGTPDDTRLVIKNVDTTNFMDSLKSALHEGGHGLYIQGLPRKTWRYQPVGQDMGAGIHESQALIIEMIIGRTLEFFKFLSPRVEGLFHGLKNPVLDSQNLHHLKTKVEVGCLRRKADEVSYFLHILHRFRLEKDLIEGRLNPADLPKAWDDLMVEIFGLEPKNYKEGCLQDVHWFVGKFGYYPAYTIGHMLSAQLFNSISKDVPDVNDYISSGMFLPIKEWLNDKIHSKGRLMDFDSLILSATGKPLSPHYLFKHLDKRYINA
jgi:carboxypeptidase Taq